jgi:hypothetical protein
VGLLKYSPRQAVVNGVIVDAGDKTGIAVGLIPSVEVGEGSALAVAVTVGVIVIVDNGFSVPAVCLPVAVAAGVVLVSSGRDVIVAS